MQYKQVSFFVEKDINDVFKILAKKGKRTKNEVFMDMMAFLHPMFEQMLLPAFWKECVMAFRTGYDANAKEYQPLVVAMYFKMFPHHREGLEYLHKQFACSKDSLKAITSVLNLKYKMPTEMVTAALEEMYTPDQLRQRRESINKTFLTKVPLVESGGV